MDRSSYIHYFRGDFFLKFWFWVWVFCTDRSENFFLRWYMDTSFLILYNILKWKREEKRTKVIMNVVNDIQFCNVQSDILTCWHTVMHSYWHVDWLICVHTDMVTYWFAFILSCWYTDTRSYWHVYILICLHTDMVEFWLVFILSCWHTDVLHTVMSACWHAVMLTCQLDFVVNFFSPLWWDKEI